METISFKEDHISQIGFNDVAKTGVYLYHSEEALELRGESIQRFAGTNFT